MPGVLTKNSQVGKRNNDDEKTPKEDRKKQRTDSYGMLNSMICLQNNTDVIFVHKMNFDKLCFFCMWEATAEEVEMYELQVDWHSIVHCRSLGNKHRCIRCNKYLFTLEDSIDCAGCQEAYFTRGYSLMRGGEVRILEVDSFEL